MAVPPVDPERSSTTTVEPLDDAPDEGPFLFPPDPDEVYSQRPPARWSTTAS